MSIFKKKNQAAESEEKGIDIKQIVLTSLNEKLQGTLYDDCVIMPRGFTIDVQLGKHDIRGEVHVIQVIYIVKNDELDEPIIEPVVSQGKDEADAVRVSVEIFCGGLWHTLNQSMMKKNPMHLTINFLGNKYEFDAYAQSIVRIGMPQDTKTVPLFPLVRDELGKYIGSKKYYWVRIFLAKSSDKVVVEVRVNGTVCPGLHKYFKEYMDSWEHFGSEEQYVIFVQREEDQCPFNKELVVKVANEAINMLQDCKSAEEYKDIVAKIEESAGDKALAAEIRIFVPEILAKLTMGYNEGDSLFLLKDDSSIEFKKTQLRSYFYIQQVALSYLSKKPEQEKVMRIVSNSVAFRELKKAHDAGHEPKDLYVPGTSYKIGLDNYRVW